MEHQGIEPLKLNSYEEVLTNERALANFDQALKLNPQSVSAWFGKGVVFVRLGCYTESIEICGRVLVYYPHDAKVLTIKGSALLDLQRFNEALADLESALRVDAENAESLKLMAITLIRLGLSFVMLGRACDRYS